MKTARKLKFVTRYVCERKGYMIELTGQGAERFTAFVDNQEGEFLSLGTFATKPAALAACQEHFETNHS